MSFKKDIPPVIPSKEMVVGDPSAKVHLTIFGDYESEATLQLNELVKQLLEDFSGKINFVFRHFPLTRLHQKAHKAAEAAIAAGQEGKFWEMHQALFHNRRNLGIISLKSYAREVGVTNKQLLDQLMNGYYGWYVQDDLREGIEQGVKDIPALFINNVRFEKPLTIENLSREIRKQLKTAATVALPSQLKKSA